MSDPRRRAPAAWRPRQHASAPARHVLAVSIIVPALNEAAVIDAALARLRRDFSDCELLVVDGGSSDATAQLATAHAQVLSTGPGRARQMNEGARHAGGDVLWFVHADTAIDPRALQQLRAALADPHTVGGGLSLRFDRRTPSLDHLARVSTLRARHLHHVFGDQAMFVRRDTFEQLGGFAPLPLMEDFEFSRRLHRAGGMVVLPATSTASSRRFTRHGTLRMIAFMQYLKLLFLAGASPERIRLRYEAGPGLALPRLAASTPAARPQTTRPPGATKETHHGD
ncbi:TIGR04283 family arsenosugar biosynthesis glycosyltransferase [Jatrophihabitans lederbergiae]|uniref:4,4'-diaponeurosporenoate glycosyltransferase n=1 Tax=Jatrophihabitans lederbergiae TaxID=3075547 RepID=A0ABU2JGG3_9ACTN|nr:TIGR04283 family arsenosugar biosynthesis glycosyltransferase [Jatrophihabitans sp. DSM 44399]MDT0263841.1 TIGR04283 family arsenosugar biosynthesis glycosyltransferase [Jatrophihabitans sp. DSM 44399]